MALDQQALEAAREFALTAASQAFHNRGIEIACPWEGDLDDLERERFDAMVAAIDAYVSQMQIDGYLAALGDGWQTIETANRSLTSRLDFPGIPKAQYSYPIWCRSQGGEPFEASWVRADSGREYWWAWDLEDVVEPDEWLPHQLDRSLPAAPTPPGEKK